MKLIFLRGRFHEAHETIRQPIVLWQIFVKDDLWVSQSSRNDNYSMAKIIQKNRYFVIENDVRLYTGSLLLVLHILRVSFSGVVT